MSRRRRQQQDEMRKEENMYYAISDNDVHRLQTLVQSGIDINMTFNGSNQWGKSAMHLCCEKGHLECAKVLAEAGADLDQQDEWYQTPLMYSVCTERPDMVEFLTRAGCDLDEKDRYGKTALRFSLHNTELDCMRQLLGADADVDVPDDMGRTPLWAAVSEDDKTEVVKLLIQSGADVDHCNHREKYTPLQVAIHYCPKDVIQYVQILLENGADVNKLDVYGCSPMTNLIYRSEVTRRCSQDDQLEIAKLLLGGGYDINFLPKAAYSTKYHGTSLKAAASQGSVPMVKLLMEHGADPDICDMFMTSPLMAAVKNNHINVVKLLLAANCRLDTSGLVYVDDVPFPATAFHLAVLKERWDIAQLLVQIGHNLNTEQYLVTNHNVPDSLVKNYEFWGWLRETMSTCRTLCELSRAKLRASLTPRLATRVAQLPIPQSVKDFILMTDLLEVT